MRVWQPPDTSRSCRATTGPGFGGSPASPSDPGTSIIGEAWNGTEWIETELVMDAIVRGDPLTDEITEAEARQIMPAAFA